MPYKSMTEVPSTLKGLTLSQANDWARYYDEAKKQEGVENPVGIAWTRFKLKYKKSGDNWVLKVRSASINRGVGNIVFNSIDNNIVKFSFIAQTEGIHTDISGKKIEYTEDILNSYGNTLVGKDISDDPAHLDDREGYRKLGANFANIVDHEILKINNTMITDFGIDESLLGKTALIAHAEGYRSDYNYLIQNDKINYYSTELTFSGIQDDNNVWQPTKINYDGVVALSNPGADPGAVFLEIYNSKYGGDKMDENKLKEELEQQRAKNAELEKKNKELQEDSDKIVEIKLEEQRTSNAKLEEEKKELEVKNAEIQKQVDELSKDEFSLDVAKGEIESLNSKNKELEEKVSKIEDMEKQIEASNSRIKEMRDEKREIVLKEHVSNADIIKKVIEQDLDDEAFNAKIDEIKIIKEEVTNENDSGIAPGKIYNTTSESFEKDWGLKQEDLVKEIVGG